MIHTRSVLVLDLDDTLIPDQTAFRAAAAATLQAVRARSDSEAVDDVLAVARTLWRAGDLHTRPEALGVSSWEALWTDLDTTDATRCPPPTPHTISVWSAALEQLGADPRTAARAAQRFIVQREHLARPYPGVLDALTRLTPDHELWLATHGGSALQRRKLRVAGLHAFFARVFISSDIGHLKTEPAFADTIAAAAQRTRTAVAAVIGDSHADLCLAANGGWPAIHICQPGTCTANADATDHATSPPMPSVTRHVTAISRIADLSDLGVLAPR